MAVIPRATNRWAVRGLCAGPGKTKSQRLTGADSSVVTFPPPTGPGHFLPRSRTAVNSFPAALQRFPSIPALGPDCPRAVRARFGLDRSGHAMGFRSPARNIGLFRRSLPRGAFEVNLPNAVQDVDMWHRSTAFRRVYCAGSRLTLRYKRLDLPPSPELWRLTDDSRSIQDYSGEIANESVTKTYSLTKIGRTRSGDDVSG